MKGSEFNLREPTIWISQWVHDHAGRHAQPTFAKHTLELDPDQRFGAGKV